MYAAKNMQVVQGYALTESCGGGSMLLGEDGLRKVGSAGRATMFAEVRVRSDDGVISERGGRRGRYQVRLPIEFRSLTCVASVIRVA